MYYNGMPYSKQYENCNYEMNQIKKESQSDSLADSRRQFDQLSPSSNTIQYPLPLRFGGKGDVYPKRGNWSEILRENIRNIRQPMEMGVIESPYRTRLCSIRKNRKCTDSITVFSFFLLYNSFRQDQV